MEAVAAGRVNDALEKMRRTKVVLESRSEELTKAAVDSEQRMKQWAKEVIKTDRRHQSVYISGVGELEEIRGQKQEMERLSRNTAEANAQETEQYREKAYTLNEQVSDLRARHEELPREKKELNNTIGDAEKRCAERKAHVNQQQERLRKSVADVRNGIWQYQRLFGLKVEAVEDCRVLFRFQYIDQEDCSAEYRIVVANPNKHFKAIECSPMIPEFGPLNQRLMEDDDLVLFLRDMRAALVKFANKAGN